MELVLARFYNDLPESIRFALTYWYVTIIMLLLMTFLSQLRGYYAKYYTLHRES